MFQGGRFLQKESPLAPGGKGDTRLKVIPLIVHLGSIGKNGHYSLVDGELVIQLFSDDTLSKQILKYFI